MGSPIPVKEKSKARLKVRERGDAEEVERVEEVENIEEEVEQVRR